MDPTGTVRKYSWCLVILCRRSFETFAFALSVLRRIACWLQRGGGEGRFRIEWKEWMQRLKKPRDLSPRIFDDRWNRSTKTKSHRWWSPSDSMRDLRRCPGPLQREWFQCQDSAWPWDSQENSGAPIANSPSWVCALSETVTWSLGSEESQPQFECGWYCVWVRHLGLELSIRVHRRSTVRWFWQEGSIP